MPARRPDEDAPNGFDGAASPGGDIPPVRWSGEPLDCEGCEHLALREAGGCALGRSCVHDRYARRIERFFRAHPGLGNTHLAHPYFEVRAIAARHADVFRLARLMDDPDETVRHSVAMRLPQRQLLRLVADPHREVRIRVAWRLEPESLALLRADADYHVRAIVARRLPAALLPTMVEDPDDAVRREVAQRLEMPALLRLAGDRSPTVRRIVAQRLPAPLLGRLTRDEDWSVRWEVVQRADARTLAAMAAGETDPELLSALRQRLAGFRAQPPQAECGGLPAPEDTHGARHG